MGRPAFDLASSLSRLATRRRIRAYAAMLFAVVVAEYLFAFATGPGLLDRFGQVKGTDFVEFYTAGRLVADGRGASLYQFGPPFQFPAQFAAEARLLGNQKPDPNFAFVVPPFYALLFIPLASLPYLGAYGIWTVFNVVLLVATLRLLRPAVSLLQGDDRRWTGLVVASFFPILESFFDGQNAVLTLFLVTVAYVALRARKEALAGVALGLALYKPQLVLVLALLLLVSGRWRSVASLALTGLALMGVSWLLVGTDGVRDYLALSRTMPTWIHLPGWRTWNMHSLDSFFALLVGDPTLALGLTAAASVLVLVSLARAWRSGDVSDPDVFDLRFALAILGTILVSPHVFAYDLSLLALPGLLLADALSVRSVAATGARQQWLRALLVLGYVIPLVSRFVALLVRLEPSVLTIAALYVMTYLVLRERSEGQLLRRQAASSPRTIGAGARATCLRR